MNFRHVARILAGFVAFFSVVQLVPLALALREESAEAVSSQQGFFAGIVTGAAVAAVLFALGRRARGELFRRETLLIAGVAWLAAGVIGAVPFFGSGLLRDPADALFESVSGLTTCGGTVLGCAGNPAPEATPPSLLLWRAMLQWLGGIGIVLAFVALMPSMGRAGKNLLMAESVGVSSEGYQPRIRTRAHGIALVYVGLTALCAVALVFFGGMSWFDAICHAFTCLATGGFSTRTNVALFDSLGVEIVLTTFMFIGGCSFTVMAGVARDGWTGLRGMLRSGEFRIYTLFTAGAILLVGIDLMRRGAGLGAALRESSFNVVSMLSCCGYATADFHVWPPLSLIVIVTCSMVGGCSGSAAGGLKQVRLLVCLKLLGHTVRRFVQPNLVERIKLDEEVLQASTLSTVLSVVLLWMLTILLGSMVLALDQRLSFVGCISASASMLGGCGPALAAVHPDMLLQPLPTLGVGVDVVGPNIGPFGGYGDLSNLSKLAMCLQMVLGRLELLPILALFAPRFWQR
ncbi:MAG: TrkH family potassium uptake protein [Planctomycetes bacterium]|nr:TrkH family potassium uptake protein [Planctomycetota bacterium]MCB9885326.1 TrkH family potassium uptake protein [Planctomycetota bacterium]